MIPNQCWADVDADQKEKLIRANAEFLKLLHVEALSAIKTGVVHP